MTSPDDDLSPLDRYLGTGADVKLVRMNKPAPSNHPDPRMNWTLDDMKQFMQPALPLENKNDK